MRKFIQVLFDTPWKVIFEIKRLLYHPFVILYLKFKGVEVGRGTKWYGFPRVFKHRQSRIIIGDRVEVRNWQTSNPLGVNHPLILTTWAKSAVIKIGHDVGITGGVICAAKKIEIGHSSLIGANSTIIDTDFHPTDLGQRRYQTINVKSLPVKIGSNVFIGMNTQILKGTRLGNNCLIGAGSVVSHVFPHNSLVMGNPVKLIKKINL